jgi:hypothetical protein
MSDRKQREFKIARKFGMHPSTREWMHAEHEKLPDWTGSCRKCGVTLTGHPSQLKAHVCGSEG